MITFILAAAVAWGGSAAVAKTFDCDAAGGFCGIELTDLNLKLTSDPIFFVPPGASWYDEGYEVMATLQNNGTSNFVAKSHGSTSDFFPGNADVLWGGGNAPSEYDLGMGESVSFNIAVVSGLKNVGTPVDFDFVPVEADDQFIIPQVSMFFSLGSDQNPTLVPPTHYVTMDNGFEAVFDKTSLPVVPLPASLPLMLAGLVGLHLVSSRCNAVN